MKPRPSAKKFAIERKQVLAADYLLFLPRGYDRKAPKRWPLIIFLHGAGERGANLRRVARHGPMKRATAETHFPFMVVSPQCPSGQSWSNELLLGLLDEIESNHAVDPRQVYLTGLSMGGYGTWSLGLSHPERFAAIAPICGGGEILRINLAADFNPAQLAPLKTLGIWAFHGGKDRTIPPAESKRMVNALKKAGCKQVKLTIYPEAGHDSWTQTYKRPELFEWFLRHSR